MQDDGTRERHQHCAECGRIAWLDDDAEGVCGECREFLATRVEAVTVKLQEAGVGDKRMRAGPLAAPRRRRSRSRDLPSRG